MRVLVTGANGFVGTALCSTLIQAGYRVRGAVRGCTPGPHGLETIAVGDICGATNWRSALRDVQAVVHTAARVHNAEEGAGSEARYIATNVDGTRHLARTAAEMGVRRLVFLSSIKVNGEGSQTRVYTADDEPGPTDPYSRSKLAAENAVFQIGRSTRMEVVVIRIPLVYGPGVKANFLKLMQWVWKGYPLPFGGINNRRSLIGLQNLCDVIHRLIDAPGAASRVWLASDGEDLSTPGLVIRIAQALEVRSRLIKVPVPVLKLAGRVAGRDAQVSRLCESLRMDSSPLTEQLGWRAPWTIDQELSATSAWFRSGERGRGS